MNPVFVQTESVLFYVSMALYLVSMILYFVFFALKREKPARSPHPAVFAVFSRFRAKNTKYRIMDARYRIMVA